MIFGIVADCMYQRKARKLWLQRLTMEMVTDKIALRTNVNTNKGVTTRENQERKLLYHNELKATIVGQKRLMHAIDITRL